MCMLFFHRFFFQFFEMRCDLLLSLSIKSSTSFCRVRLMFSLVKKNLRLAIENFFFGGCPVFDIPGSPKGDNANSPAFCVTKFILDHMVSWVQHGNDSPIRRFVFLGFFVLLDFHTGDTGTQKSC